eukprot:g8442.t1
MDIRSEGSGNIGATNIARVLGAKWGVLVLLLDCMKGLLPVLFVPPLLLTGHEDFARHGEVICGIATIVGHMLPFWLRFRGGKGVATALGVAIALGSWATLAAFGGFLLAMLLFRIVSLASMVAAITFAVVQMVVRDFTGGFADAVETDWHGNVSAVVNPQGSPRIMLAGHCDQIGLLVQHIDASGFLRINPIGGWDPQILLGQKMQVWTAGGPVNGVIARKPIHLLTEEERAKVPTINELWVDIGARSGDEAREIVSIGDPITLELGMRELRNQLAAAAGMDNRVGVWVVMSALQRVSRENPEAAVYAVSTVQEEIGLRGARTSAFSIDPQLGIAVDVTHASDCPTIEESTIGCVKVGSGPVVFRGPNINPVVFRQLDALANEHSIPFQPNGIARAASNDGNALQINRAGVATGIIGIPNRYMHSPVEVVSLDDLENAAELIARFCLSVRSDSDFTP